VHRLANPVDRYFRWAIGQWRTLALDALHTLDTWRGDPDEYSENYPEDNARQGIAWLLEINTTEIVRKADALSLDSRPVQAFCGVIVSWNRDVDADGIPDRRGLLGLFTAALAALDAIEGGIYRGADGCPIPAPRSIDAADGPAPEGDGAITPVAPDGRKYTRKGGAKLKLISEIRQLVDAGEWGWTDRRIALGADVDHSTLSRLLSGPRADDLVRDFHSWYRNRGVGKPPANLDDF
jgi:hypothetical protein